MNYVSHIAKHFNDVHFGGNWTSVNLRDTLEDLDWKEATLKIGDCNTIAVLVFHINYYISAVKEVLRGGVLDAHDKFSFDLTPIHSKEDWDKLKEKSWNDAKEFEDLLRQLPEDKLAADFTDKKYGDYYRNLHGIIEHCHYHLGQIVILKKLIRSENKDLRLS